MIQRFGTSLVLLLMLLVAFVPPATFAQDTATYTAADGLTVEYPASWAVTEQFGVVSLSNTEAGLEARQMQPDMVLILVFGSEMVGTAFAIGPDSDLAAAADRLGETLAGAGNYTVEESDLGGQTAYQVSYRQSGIEGLVFMRDLDGQIVIVNGAAAEGQLANFEGAIRDVAASLRYGGSAAPADSADSSDDSAEAGPVSGEGAVVWQNQFEISIELPALDDIAVAPDDAIYVNDLFKIFPVGPAGELGPAIEPADAPLISGLAAGQDMLWVIDTGQSPVALLALDLEGNTLASSSLSEGFGDAVVRFPEKGLTVGPDGNLYVFTSVAGDAMHGYVSVYDSRGEMLRRWEVTAEREDLLIPLFTQNVALDFTPDGNLFLYDMRAYTGRVLSPEDGSVLEETVLDLSEALATDFAYDIALGPDGSFILALGSGTLVQYDAEGNRLAEFGQAQAPEDMAGEFAPGDFLQPALAVLSDGHLVVADSNGVYSQVVRINFADLAE